MGPSSAALLLLLGDASVALRTHAQGPPSPAGGHDDPLVLFLLLEHISP